MEDINRTKAVEKRGRGRPRKYDTPAERVAAYRENHLGQRYDVYLEKDAHAVMLQLMKRTGLPASKVLDGVLTRKIKLPVAKGG